MGDITMFIKTGKGQSLGVIDADKSIDKSASTDSSVIVERDADNKVVIKSNGKIVGKQA